MRIGLAARWLDLPAGGAREYTLNLIESLLRIDSGNEYFVFHGSQANMGKFPTATEVLLPARNTFWWDYVQLPAAVAPYKIDLFWTPSYIVPFPIHCKAVASVLDLAYFTLPQSYQLLDVVYMQVGMPRSFRRADALLSISEYTKLDMLRLFPFTVGKVVVTHLAPASRFRQSHDVKRLDAIRAKYGLPIPYIFYAGSISPRKGLQYLLEAFASLKQGQKIPHRLVFTGGWSWGSVNFRELIEGFGLQDQITRLGQVPAEDMPLLYELADLFVYPSLYEGFGLPVLEAMACGCPVVCSNLTALPEVAGDAALAVDPRDAAALQVAIYCALTDQATRLQLKQKGLERASRFTWESTARRTLEVFECVARR